VDKEEVAEAIRGAAIVLLHREIRAHGYVSLTQSDFNDASFAELSEQEITLTLGPNEEVILSHTKQDLGRTMS
jgi:hypothetical protein